MARLIGTTRPIFIRMGNGIGDQTNDGTSTISAVCLIAAITGNLDVPGGQFAARRGRPGAARSPCSTSWLPPGMVERLVAPESPVWYQTTGRWESGPTSAYYKGLMSILTEKPYPLRVLNASCCNPLSATRNPRKVAEALKKLDFMFVMDVFHAPHVDFADIVLPACTSYEQGDFFGVQAHAGRHLGGAATTRWSSRWASRAATGGSTSIWPSAWATASTSGRATWTPS